MHPYPPWYVDWPAAVCPTIIPVIVLVILSVLACRNRRARLWIAGVAGVIVLWMLACALMSATGDVREAARRTACRNNLRLVARAIHESHDEHHRLPPPRASVDGGPPVSWRIDILSYGKAPNDSEFAAGYDRSLPWDDAANVPIAQREPQLYRCPSSRNPQDAQHRWYTAYAFVTGPGTAFPESGPLTLGDISDGTSNTLLVVEACGRNIVWTEPRDVDVSRETSQINAPGDQLGTSAGIASSYHERGAQAALADGSVRMLSTEMYASVLRALTTAAEGDEAGEF